MFFSQIGTNQISLMKQTIARNNITTANKEGNLE